MSSERIDQETGQPAGAGGQNRRRFLRRAVVAGAGLVGLTAFSERPVSAGPKTETLVGSYTIQHNDTVEGMQIENQNGSTFAGQFGDGTRISGTAAGASPGPIALSFVRTTADGSPQLFTGAASVNGGKALLAGTYSQDGTGPYPWVAVGTIAS